MRPDASPGPDASPAPAAATGLLARLAGAYTGACVVLSRLALGVAVLGLLLLILAVQYQVVGRYVFNDTPTWAEALSMLLVLYVTAFAVAVGVRDGGHIGFESLVNLLPARGRQAMELLAHALVALFGALMVHSGWMWTTLKWDQRKPMLGVPEGMDFLPLVIAGALIVLFSIEHIVARLRGTPVEPAWN